MAALQSSVSPIPHLTVNIKLKPTSLLSTNRNPFFVDFVGLYCKSKRVRRRIGVSSNQTILSPTNSSVVKAVLDLQRQRVHQSSHPQQKQEVANLEDIISERGACGVGFIANLENKASHEIVKDALSALGCMEHRGGCGADNDSGDGSGLMTSIPWDLFNNWAEEEGIASFDRLHTGVGMVFLPKDDDLLKKAKEVIINTFRQEGLEVLGWRSVPVNMSVVGYYAKETLPNIEQVFVKVIKEENVEDIERELYICRKLIERAAALESWGNELYFCSLSNQTIVYKGMLRSEVLGLFYTDLRSDVYKTSFAIYHRRYSTNTSPRWPLAQPMRLLGHNGEINTIQGNLNWMQSREASLKSPVWHGRENEIRPFGNPKASDSANLDSAAERILYQTGFQDSPVHLFTLQLMDCSENLTSFLLYFFQLLLRSGRSPEEALMILVPEAYKNHPTLMIKYPEVVDFYDYYKGQMETWDGPALLLFSDGKTVGACLDRNGLRPARYWRTIDNVVYVASEVCYLSSTICCKSSLKYQHRVGVVPVDDAKITMKGRLGPGMMIAVDLQSGQVCAAISLGVYENTEVKKRVAALNPYGKWLSENMRSLKPVNFLSMTVMDNESILRHQQAFGYSSEDVQMVIETMASQGKEPTFCMGDDIPLAVLSQRPHMLYDYFKQRFAQDMHLVVYLLIGKKSQLVNATLNCMVEEGKVTNPAIDPLREGLVMSLEVNIGKRRNILEVGPENACQVSLSSPVLNEGELESLLKDPFLKPQVLPTFFDIRKGVESSLVRTLHRLCEAADEAVRNGSQLLVLSDRSDELWLCVTVSYTYRDMDAIMAGYFYSSCTGWSKLLSFLPFGDIADDLFELDFSCTLMFLRMKFLYLCHVLFILFLRQEPTQPAIPILLAVGAVHQHLIQNGLRMSASIVADTAQCFSTHQFACLIGYGASAVCPYLALETCRQWRLSTKTLNLMRNGKMPTVTIEQAQTNFCKAVKSGLLKILSKMGISLLSSYCGAQIFEVYGLGKEVVDLAFTGSVSNIGGLTFDELARESLSFWVKAFSEDTAKRLENYGFIQFRPGGEYHGNNPEMSKLLHKAVRQKSESSFSIYQQHLANRPVNVLRDLLEFKSDRTPIPVGKVEPASAIVERFCTGGMSLGAISRETHEAIAIAMNRLGGKSNSGEGGEDPVRWNPLSDVVDGYSPTLPHLKGLQNGDTATSAIKQVMSLRYAME
ncbi:hypothetical protein Patl1_20916 [Pistacia atlantica]|uniref:Uncharacterized protein n=1 Tax=Pistacia atlantica TaxID=434234 RepID=A0ACC1BHL9_9ROSI|nr:hypothetical protein Patl1_20916 [Pistacia atlantica]